MLQFINSIKSFFNRIHIIWCNNILHCLHCFAWYLKQKRKACDKTLSVINYAATSHPLYISVFHSYVNISEKQCCRDWAVEQIICPLGSCLRPLLVFEEFLFSPHFLNYRSIIFNLSETIYSKSPRVLSSWGRFRPPPPSWKWFNAKFTIWHTIKLHHTAYASSSKTVTVELCFLHAEDEGSSFFVMRCKKSVYWVITWFMDRLRYRPYIGNTFWICSGRW